MLLQHIGVQIGVLGLAAWLLGWIFGLPGRPALLFALAMFTPSTGFILDSLPTLGLDQEEQYWVKSNAIAAELVALLILFLAVQSADIQRLLLSVAVLAGMVAILPRVFILFDRIIAPWAPRSEFTFLILVALLCAYVTRELGVYYLVGAFVVGVTAVKMRKGIPSLGSDRLVAGVELFAAFFIPFYFFKSGLHLRAEHFSATAVGIALILLVTVIPLRVGRIAVHRAWILDEPRARGARIGTAMIPTLVFTIVIAEILRDSYSLPPNLFGALIVFALVNTLIPGFVLRTPPPEFENPRVEAVTPVVAE